MQLLGFPDYEPQATTLAAALGMPYATVDVHRFPDGESRIRLPATLPEHVVFCRSLDHGNDKLVEILLAAETARALGAARLTLVAPYLCYMRQDIAFQAGEAVSQRIVGRFLAGLFDALETLRKAGIRNIWSSDSVKHPSNSLRLASLLATALQ